MASDESYAQRSRDLAALGAEGLDVSSLREVTAVGDLNSDAKGSGARKNEGKDQLDLIPVRFWRMFWAPHILPGSTLDEFLSALQDWQEGDTNAIHRALQAFDIYTQDAVKVFMFGAHKYKAWNWAKGMAWSVPTGCILRHIRAYMEGEMHDEDSGELHMGHVLCNTIMLAWYVDAYPEGDDRPIFKEDD